MKKIIIVLLLSVGILFSACSNSTSNSGITNSNTDNQVNTNTQNNKIIENSQNNLDARIIKIDAFNFEYSKKEINVKVGEKIKIIMTNSGGNHNFVIDELGVKTPIIKTGETTEVEFTATKAGTYFFYCSVGSHRTAGMEGKIIIT